MSNPRIIAGKVKGLRLKTLSGTITRPITDRVKEALFNIIGTDIREASFLDLFGGSGSVGIEALSRGAAYVEFVELNNKAYVILKENLSHSGLESSAKIIKGDAFKYINPENQRAYDYIFIAPPQYHGLWKDSLVLLDQNPDLLSDEGWVIVQIDPVEDEEIHLEHFNEFDNRKYGSTLLKFYAKS
jgi:16S rRNA (guanine966-N2)-methyltransferase